MGQDVWSPESFGAFFLARGLPPSSVLIGLEPPSSHQELQLLAGQPDSPKTAVHN